MMKQAAAQCRKQQQRNKECSGSAISGGATTKAGLAAQR
jgi:hypothetical protein